jgi:hypothetical protein
MPDDTPLEEKPISWALYRLGKNAPLFAELTNEERVRVYEAVGLPQEAIDAIERRDPEALQELVNAEWPGDPDVVFHALLRGVVR